MLEGILHRLHVEITLLHAQEQVACHRERILLGHVRQANLISPVPLLPEMVSRNLTHLWNEAPQALGAEESHVHSPCLPAADSSTTNTTCTPPATRMDVAPIIIPSCQEILSSSRKIDECKKNLTLNLLLIQVK